MQTCGHTAGHGTRRWWVAEWFAIALVACASASLPAQTADTSRTPAAAALPDTTPIYRPVSFTDYVFAVVGPRALLRDVAIAGFDQATSRSSNPNSRPKNWQGYGDRVSERAGAEAIAQTIVFGLSFTLDMKKAKFSRCFCPDSGSRLNHALLTPFRVDTPHGQDLSFMPATAELIGGIIVTSFTPEGFSAGRGVASGITRVMSSSVMATAREFWPWKWRPFGF